MTRALVLVAAAALAAPALSSAEATRNQTRALWSYSTMRKTLWMPSASAYRGSGKSSEVAHAWPYSQALWATVELASLPRLGPRYLLELRARLADLQRYRSVDPAMVGYASRVGGAGDTYYDDNEWIALALVRAYDLTHDPALLARASELFSFVAGGWDGDTTHPCAGGVFWMHANANHDRNTVSTANAALLGALLYQRTHDASQLAWARQMYAWVGTCLGSDLVLDHLDLGGRIDARTFSYNQGAMVAAAAELYRSTGDPVYFADARTLAAAATAHLPDPVASGEPAEFLAIFCRDLLELSPDDYRPYVQAFADASWDRARDPRSGIFRFAPNAANTLLTQSAMVQVYGELAILDG